MTSSNLNINDKQSQDLQNHTRYHTVDNRKWW